MAAVEFKTSIFWESVDGDGDVVEHDADVTVEADVEEDYTEITSVEDASGEDLLPTLKRDDESALNRLECRAEEVARENETAARDARAAALEEKWAREEEDRRELRREGY